MTLYYNQATEKTRRASFRKNLTKSELILWSKLKSRQMMGYKFRRQFSVDRFILDFYCPEIKLAIEVDGESSHIHLNQSSRTPRVSN